MLLNVVCFLSLGVYGCIVSLCSGCVGCCAFCLICDAWSCKCWYIGSMLVSSCRCCLLVSCVHPVAILSAVFRTICSLAMLVSDALGDQMVESYSCTGLVIVLYAASMVSICLPHFVEVRTLSMLIVLRALVAANSMCVVSEFRVKCESQYFWVFGHGLCCVVYLKSELCAIFCCVRGE